MLNAAFTLAVTGLLALSHNSLRSDDVLQHPQSEERSNQRFPGFKLRLVTLSTGKCLDASDRKVFTGICNMALIPMWERDLPSQSLKHIVTGKCLEMSLAGHGRVYLATCDFKNTQQRWDLSSQYIRNVRLNLCLNEKAQVAPCRPEDNMKWTTEKYPY